MDIANERRSSLRTHASTNAAQVRWSQTHCAGEAEAQVVDISLGGALIACEDRSAADCPVWLRLREPWTSCWVEARVARRPWPGLVAVAFDRPCPHDLLWSATLGIGFGNLLHDSGDHAGDGRSGDDWMF
jgi:hypothetical protein